MRDGCETEGSATLAPTTPRSPGSVVACSANEVGDTLVEADGPNLYDRLQAMDVYSDGELKMLLVGAQADSKDKSHQQSLVMKSRNHYNERCERLTLELANAHRSLVEIKTKVCFRPGRHVTTSGGYSLATRRNRGHVAAGTAA